MKEGAAVVPNLHMESFEEQVVTSSPSSTPQVQENQVDALPPVYIGSQHMLTNTQHTIQTTDNQYY